MKKNTRSKAEKRKARTSISQTSAQALDQSYRRIQAALQEPLCEHLSEVISEWSGEVYGALHLLGLAEDKKMLARMDAVVEINCKAERELMSALEELLYDAREEARQREELQRLTAESIVREADTKFPPLVAQQEPWWRSLQKWWSKT